MILGFKTKIDGKPTHFVQKILACQSPDYRKAFTPKKHTIRAGNRWKAGMTIHMATGVRTKDYFRFNGDGIGLDKCISVQDIEIKYMIMSPAEQCTTFTNSQGEQKIVKVLVDGKPLKRDKIATLAINDGFESVEAFFEWFDKNFTGQIIHWTDTKY